MSMARKIGTFICIPFLVSLSAAAAEANKAIIDDPAYSQPQRLVEIEPGRKLNLYCLGEGAPTVIFDSGLTDETAVWGLVQPIIGKRTRACTYDRAGSGFSDPGTRAGSSAHIVDDLHRLLVAASVKPPYILVGHSYGGMNVRLYANYYPTEVIGMVLVDPAHEGWREHVWHLDPSQENRAVFFDNEPDFQAQRACVNAAISGFIAGSELHNSCVPEPNLRFGDAINTAHLKIHLTPSYQQANLTELENFQNASATQLSDSRRWYGDMPLIVLAAGIRPGPRADQTQAHRDALNRVWIVLYDQLAALSTRGINRVVPDTDHFVPLNQPDAIITAISEVMDRVAKAK